jgi:ankyrin repeat protein
MYVINNGDTALIGAARYGYKEVIEMSLNAKAKVDMQGNDGDTALIRAARKSHK